MNVIRRNNVHTSGSAGPLMLFSHGFGCDQNMWRFVAPAFAAEYRIVLFDHVGAGGSDLSAYDKRKYASLDGYAADVLEICAELRLSDVVFVGHSVSAIIGVLAARKQPARFKPSSLWAHRHFGSDQLGSPIRSARPTVFNSASHMWRRTGCG